MSNTHTDTLNDNFLKARERGKNLVKEITSQKNMLSIHDVSQKLGLSEDDVKTLVHDHKLIALRNKEEHLFFPDWQFGDDGKPLKVIPELYNVLGDSWFIYFFLIRQYKELEERTALEALKNGEKDRVFSLAESIQLGDFG